jgi:histidine ammonia-lyase
MTLVPPATHSVVAVNGAASSRRTGFLFAVRVFTRFTRGGARSSIGHLLPACALLACTWAVPAAAAGAPNYNSIDPKMADRWVTLTGHDMSIEQVVAVARFGAKVRFSAEAIREASEAAGLRAEAGAEHIPVYGLNRGGGALREVAKRDEPPLTAISPIVGAGALPEIADEDLVRAALVIGANTAPYAAASPESMQMLVDLLNKRVTPVAHTRGTLGEADFPAMMNNILATIAGRGDAYYQGVRMRAADALKRAGLKPRIAEVETGGAGGAENAYGDALAALLVYDGRHALQWADLIHAMDKLGMNSSLTPLVAPVQAKRPFKWVNWDAARIMDMLRGSYLFDDDPKRILQDPESMRASYIRQGAAWQAWAALRDAVLIQINSADQNPLVIVGASPQDSWELSTPQMMKYFVKGGELSHGQHGYVFSTANWDPYPLVNEVEAFTNALANMDAAVAQRIERFSDRGPTAFFTGIKPADVLTPAQIRASPALSEPFFVFMDLWAEIQFLSRSITPEGNAADIGVADIEAHSRLKGSHAREVVDLTIQLLGYDLLVATYWLDVRKAEDSNRHFGQAPTAAWQAFRKVLPWQQDPAQRPDVPYGIIAYNFLKSTRAPDFHPTQQERLGPDAKSLSDTP